MKELGNSIASKLSLATGLRNKGCFQQYDHGSTLYYWSDKCQWDIPGDSSVGGLSDYFGIITWAAKFGFPGIIIEHAYLSNPNDLAIVDKEENLRKMGEADAEAIINYYTGHDHSYASEYTLDYPVSCFSAGKQSMHCTVCGHRKDVRSAASAPDPEKHLWLSEDAIPREVQTIIADTLTILLTRAAHNSRNIQSITCFLSFRTAIRLLSIRS